jgi:polyhydroxyalkanoate synthesis regulator phasin
MLDALRSLVEAGVGAIPSERAEKLARSLVDRGEDLMARVGREARKQMRTLGIVTAEELSELKKRVRQLEREASKPSSSPDGSAKRAAPGSAKAAAGKGAAKRGAARPPGS